MDIYHDNVVVMGAHWTGKTRLVAEILLKPRINFCNMWIWDYHGKLTEYVNPNPSLIKYEMDSLEYGTQFFIPPDKSEKAFEKFLGKALTHKDLEITIDEAHNYSSAHKLKGNHAELIRNAQNKGVSYIEIFQRPQRVNGDVLENARHRFNFMLDDTNSVKKMRDWIGVEVEYFLSPFNRSPVAKTNLPHLTDSIIHTSEEAKTFFEQNDMLIEHSYLYRDKKFLRPEVYSGGLQL